MTDALAARAPDRYLTANVTPWWWERYWATSPPKMLDAVRIIRALPWAQDAMITISLSQITLTFETLEGSDLSALHRKIRELRIFFDEMVPLPQPSASDPVS